MMNKQKYNEWKEIVIPQLVAMWEAGDFIVEIGKYNWCIYSYLLDAKTLLYTIYLEDEIHFVQNSNYKTLNNIQNTRKIVLTMEHLEMFIKYEKEYYREEC